MQAVVPGTNGGTTTFKYDPFGRRIEKISPTAASIFVYDGVNLIETVNGSAAKSPATPRCRISMRRWQSFEAARRITTKLTV